MALKETTESPNGAAITTAVRRPASPVVRMRSGPAARRSHPIPEGAGASSSPQPPAGQRARRIVTTATIGTRIASCGLISAATTARIAERSPRPRHSSRTASSRNTVPKLSTWPHTTESNQVIGLKMTTAAASVARRSVTPRSRAIAYTTYPSAMSVRIAGSLIRSPVPPMRLPTMPIGHRA